MDNPKPVPLENVFSFTSRATKHIGEIIALIKKLETKGLAYEVNGDVYFDTQAYRSSYGKLSGQNLDDLESGARVEVGDLCLLYTSRCV